MFKNKQFILTTIKKTLSHELTWLPADNYFAMPEDENPELFSLLSYLDIFENSGRCYFATYKQKSIFIFFFRDGIQVFLQKDPYSKLFQLKDVDRALLYRLYNAVRSSQKTASEELDELTESFFS